MSERWWWLSFADSLRPEGYHFLGAAIVHARDFYKAVEKAEVLGIDPGGQVWGHRVIEPPACYRNRLMSKEVLSEWCPDLQTLDELDGWFGGAAEE